VAGGCEYGAALPTAFQDTSLGYKVVWANSSRIAEIAARGSGSPSAAFFAAGHDGGVEALAETVGQVVDFVGAVDFDGLAGGVEDDFAVAAAVQVLFNSARVSAAPSRRSDRRAGRETQCRSLSTLASPGLASGPAFFLRK
jgi:hypothetical protein